jgi:hypothetical protein
MGRLGRTGESHFENMVTVTTALTVTRALVTPHARHTFFFFLGGADVVYEEALCHRPKASPVSLVLPVPLRRNPRLARTTPPGLGGLGRSSTELSTMDFRSCRFVILLFYLFSSSLWVSHRPFPLLTFIALYMYLYVDEPVRLVVLATPVIFALYLLA